MPSRTAAARMHVALLGHQSRASSAFTSARCGGIRPLRRQMSQPRWPAARQRSIRPRLRSAARRAQPTPTRHRPRRATRAVPESDVEVGRQPQQQAAVEEPVGPLAAGLAHEQAEVAGGTVEEVLLVPRGPGGSRSDRTSTAGLGAAPSSTSRSSLSGWASSTRPPRVPSLSDAVVRDQQPGRGRVVVVRRARRRSARSGWPTRSHWTSPLRGSAGATGCGSPSTAGAGKRESGSMSPAVLLVRRSEVESCASRNASQTGDPSTCSSQAATTLFVELEEDTFAAVLGGRHPGGPAVAAQGCDPRRPRRRCGRARRSG